MYAPGGPPPPRAYVMHEDRAQMRQYGLSVLRQAFPTAKFTSKLPLVVERTEEEIYKKYGSDQAAYFQFFKNKIDNVKNALSNPPRPQMQQPQQMLAAEQHKHASHGAAVQQHPHHQHPQQAQFSQAGVQHGMPHPQQQLQHPQMRQPQLEAETGMAVTEQSAAEQADDFNDFLGTFFAPSQQQQQQPQQQPPQMGQPLYAPQQQPQQPVGAYAQPTVAAQQQQAGQVGRPQPSAVTTVAAAAVVQQQQPQQQQQQQQQMHMAGKMAGMSAPHAGPMAGMQALPLSATTTLHTAACSGAATSRQQGYPQAMGAAQMGVQLPAPRAGGPAAAFPQSQAAGGVMAGHGAPGPAAGQAGLMGAAGGMTVDQTIAGMYGGGLPVQPGGPPQHGSGGMVGIPGQPVSGMMGQMAQQHQQHAGVGMAVAGSAAPGAPMGIMPPQQAAAPHPHVHAVSVAPTPSTQMPYGMPPGQQQDMSYAQLNQHQLMAHQAAVAAAAQQQQHAQQQQQQQHAQQQQAAVAAAVQQQAAQVMGRVASGSLPPQGAVAAAAAAAASRKAGPMPMGPAAAVAASQVSRPGAVAGTGMPAGPNLATQQQPPQPQQQQQPQPAVAVPPMGTTANPVYGGAPTVAGLASPAVGMPGVHGAAAPPPSGGPPPIVPGGAMPVAQHTAAGLAATTTAPPVPPVAASAAANNVQSASTPVLPGSSHVVVLQDVTPLLMEDYWKAIAALKTRVHVLRAQLDKYTKVAEQQGPQGKAQRSRRILLEAFKRCTVDPNTPEYSSMPVSATSVKLMLAVLSSLDNSIQMGRRPGAVPATAAAPQQPGPALAVGTESAAGPVASPEAVRPAAATPPIPQAPQPQPQSQPQSQPQPQPLHPAGAGGAVVPAAKPDGVGAVGTAPSPPCVNPPAAASVSANRAAAAAVVAAAAHNAKIRGLKPLGHRPLPGKAGGESAGLHGKMPMDSDYKASLQAALHQGKDAKLERNEDSVSPGVDQVHRLLGLLAQPLPHSTLRVHASRGAADVLNFDWDSLMPSLPATACAQITAAAAAGAASGTSAGPPRARTVSMCRVSGMQYIDGGGSVRTVPTATGSDDTRGALAVKWQRQVADGAEAADGVTGADGGSGTSAPISSELKRRRELVQAACHEVEEELGETVALRLVDSSSSNSSSGSSPLLLLAADVGGGGDDALVLECDAVVGAAGEAEHRIAGSGEPAAAGSCGPRWKRLRVCLPRDYPEASPIPTFSSADAAYTHPYARAARLHFQTALQSGHGPLHLSLRSVAKTWRDAVARVCGAVRSVDAVAVHIAATPATAAV